MNTENNPNSTKDVNSSAENDKTAEVKTKKTVKPKKASNKTLPFIIIGILIMVLLVTVNAISVNPKQLKANEKTISSDKIADSAKGQIIVFFSDLHFSEVNDQEKLNKLEEMVSQYDPALVIFGGDLSDIELEDDDREALKNCLSSIKASYGKLALMGDEDSEEDKELLESCGFTYFDNDTVKVYFTSTAMIEVTNGDVYRDPSIYTLDVAHKGDDLQSGDLLIGGHSLGGQIYIPLINLLYREEGSEKYYHGSYKKDGAPLIISNGTGGKEKGTRLWADAEINVFRID